MVFLFDVPFFFVDSNIFIGEGVYASVVTVLVNECEMIN